MSQYQRSTLKPGEAETSVVRDGNAAIPLDMDNRDCVQFLCDWKSGPLSTVKNADGTDAPYSDDAVRALGLTP